MAASGRTDAPMENAAMESRTSFRRIAALVLALALGWTAAARAQDEVSLRGSAEVEGTASEWKLGEGTARRIRPGRVDEGVLGLGGTEAERKHLGHLDAIDLLQALGAVGPVRAVGVGCQDDRRAG